MTTLIDRYKAMADEGGNFHGLSILHHAPSIKKLAHSVGAGSMLDFGCGRGDAYSTPHKLHHQLGISRRHVRLYDPAFRKHDEFPIGKWDLVVCSDVLEHVAEADVDQFLGHLFEKARMAVWASVCCRPAKKCFPGTDTNLHVTVQPFEWWDAKFQRASEHFGIKGVLVETA